MKQYLKYLDDLAAAAILATYLYSLQDPGLYIPAWVGAATLAAVIGRELPEKHRDKLLSLLRR